MGGMHFPSQLTEEEEILQQKYAKLKKKVSSGLSKYQNVLCYRNTFKLSCKSTNLMVYIQIHTLVALMCIETNIIERRYLAVQQMAILS